MIIDQNTPKQFSNRVPRRKIIYMYGETVPATLTLSELSNYSIETYARPVRYVANVNSEMFSDVVQYHHLKKWMRVIGNTLECFKPNSIINTSARV